MAAGLGFKTFTTGEVLTAADTNGYLMQGINVFASTAARDAAITSPQEGQFAFTKDTNGLWYYDGAAWVASGAAGDIEGVTAGIGISGGGTSGTVTVTNSMATAIDAKGDLVPGTGADTFSRLAVGANDTVLTADSTAATGLKWATPASGSTFAGCRVYNSAQQSIPNNTNTLLTFDSELWDTNTYHDTLTNTGRFTIPAGKGGYYSVYCQTSISNNASGWRQFMLYKNGTLFGQGSVIGGVANYISPYMNVTVNLAVGDYIEFYAFQDSGGALNCDTRDGVYSYFGINYLGA